MVAKEITIMRDISGGHANIVSLREVFYNLENPCKVFLVVDPWAPVTLWDTFLSVMGRGISREDILWYQTSEVKPWPSIIQQCLEGLNYLHNMKPEVIKHKDLTPRNILLLHKLGGHVRPIITDFGNSKYFVPNGKTSSNIGTLLFLAPEEENDNERRSSLASDVWHLGCSFALILILFALGVKDFKQFWASVLEPDGPKAAEFRRNPKEVELALDNAVSGKFRISLVLIGHSRFAMGLGNLTIKMLNHDEGDRPTVAAALRVWNANEVFTSPMFRLIGHAIRRSRHTSFPTETLARSQSTPCDMIYSRK
ncbi:MAG: hypothetical protein M1814_000517 [Vezdaea aestivalis]|nr:MAG: hypothetical protein M1814_000517 [Vezdaea aestivalis]